jgi:hypothetical protein
MASGLRTIRGKTAMKSKLILSMILVLIAAACGGRSRAGNAVQQNYETVEEGSASGVTSTIHGPGESLPPITETNADTTTAFALNPNVLPPSQTGTYPPPQALPPMTSASTTPQPAPRPVASPPPTPQPRPEPPPEPERAEPQPPEPIPPTNTDTTATTTAPPPPPADDTSGKQAEEEPPPPPPQG